MAEGCMKKRNQWFTLFLAQRANEFTGSAMNKINWILEEPWRADQSSLIGINLREAHQMP